MVRYRKPKVAIISLSSCQGCQFAILDLGEKFTELLDYLNIKRFRLLGERSGGEEYDLTFVEGTPIKKEQEKTLLKIRKNTRFLVALGNCAAMGGIQEIKNYRNKKKIASYVYKHHKSIDNLEIKELRKLVKVDAIIPGCPIEGEDFLQIIYDFLVDKKIKSCEEPVCAECQTNKCECLLQKKKACFGPWIRGGCKAVCLKGGLPCWGCRGLLKDADIPKMLKTLKEITLKSEQEIKKQLEVFGVRDEVENRLKVKDLCE